MKPINAEQLSSSLSAGSKKRLMGFLKSLSTDREKVIFDDRVVDELLEYSLKPDKVREVIDYLNHCEDDDGFPYSQSLRQYAKLETAILEFAKPGYTSFRHNVNYQKALEMMRKRFSSLRLKPVVFSSSEEIYDNLPKVNTHSGWAYIQHGLRHKGEFKEDLFSMYKEEEEAARVNGSFNAPILPGTRTQGSGAFGEDGEFTDTCKHKTRLVAMVSLWVIIAELGFAKPIQAAMAKMNMYAGGKDPSKISTVIAHYRRNNNFWLSADYSGYDASLSRWIIEDAFDILKSAFQSVDEELWKIVVTDFIEKNYVTPNGVVHSEKGVPSGSMFTQIIDTVCNGIIMLTYLNSIGARGDMIMMGDDNLVFTDVEIDPEAISSYVRKNFGVMINATKTTRGRVSDNPEFLSREWRAHGQWRHPHVLISKLAFPERFRNYGEGVTPAEVLFGYVLTYRLGMDELMDVGRFLRDHQNASERVMEKVDSRYVPGALAYLREYTMVA